MSGREGNEVGRRAINDRLRPIPVPDDVTRPFWEAVRDGRLAIQRCQSCRTYYHPPVVHCYECESRSLAFENVSGRGTIYAFSVMRRVAEPYAIAHVTLAEGPTMLTNIVDCDFDKLSIGQAVALVFKESENGQPVPMFAPA